MKRILITGAAGSVGQALEKRLRDLGYRPITTDIDSLDVTDSDAVDHWINTTNPDTIYHLAGAKHAPEGELNPGEVARVNIDGTRNIVQAAWPGTRIILASTCKAADPETAYGASKLIAERMVLNAGGVVTRFYNIPESSGNVFRLWESLPEDAPIPYTDCLRFFVSMEKAVQLLVRALELPSGRYAPEPGRYQKMEDVAWRLYPGRNLMRIPRRRGDRRAEPRHGESENFRRVSDGINLITSPHDPAPQPHPALEEMIAA